MKGRLLLGLLAIATAVLVMYYKLCKIHPELVSGFIVLGTGIISHVINSAEDILVSLFKIGDVPKPPVLPLKAPPSGPGTSTVALNPTNGGQASLRAVLGLCLICMTGYGCASWGLNHMKGTVNGAFVYNGVPVIGNVQIDHWGCIGFNCPTANIMELMQNADSGSTNNSSK